MRPPRVKISRSLRKFARSVRDLLHINDDILSNLDKSRLAELASKIEHGEIKDIESAEARKRQIVPRKKYQTFRDWLDVLVVAGAVAMGLRALFLQPFNIPTSSMQPTLFGVHFVERTAQTNFDILGSLVAKVVYGAEPIKRIVESPGVLSRWNESRDKSIWTIGNRDYILPGSAAKAADYAKIDSRREYKTGDVLVDGFWTSGDHLFVDRVSHHFGGFARGDVAVFTTENLAGIDGKPLQGYYYIKRIVGVPGDTLKIENNILYVKPSGAKDFTAINQLDERFERLYSGQGGYQGHSNLLSGDVGGGMAFSKFLRTPGVFFVVPQDSYFALGDNTLFSADSRVFGAVPRRNMIGKALNVFWPLSRRWGLADDKEALDVKTTKALNSTYGEMFLQ